MTKEAFEQDVFKRLQSQLTGASPMERQDAVKFVFQAMLGVGHLLSDRESAAAYIAHEMEGLPADPKEPLFERLSPAWCRLNLRRAMAERLRPQVIAGMMIASGCDMGFTRRDVYAACKRMAQAGEGYFADGELEQILDESWLPAHSAAYRERYHPAYRVISADWIPCLEAVRRIAQRSDGTERLLVTLDGPCASGKTTLAEKLARVFRGEVIHTDDFVVPHARKTPERLAIPGGNCDAERLAREVAAPFKRGDPVVYRRYDCRNDSLLLEERLASTGLLILEGSYCNVPAIRQYADVRLFLDVPWPIREVRLVARESPSSLQRFYDRWIPLENAYFEACRLPDENCVVIRPEQA